MTLAQLIYGACSAAFLGLIALVLVRGRINGRGLVIVIASALTAMWATDLTFHGCLPEWLGPILDAGRLSAWLIAAVLLLGSWDKGTGISGSIPIVLSVSFSAIVIGTEAGVLVVYPPRLSTDMGRVLDLLHAGLAVGGLLAIENVLRNVDDARRRKLWPLCLALGGIFAFELFIYANVLMAPTAGAILLEGRGVIGVFAVPLIALTIIRNREWGIDIHMSRTVVLHTAALITTGIFFLGLSAIAVVVRNFGGSWGPALQTVVLLGSAIVLVFVLGARELRIRLKQFISRHFFSNRFDYRAEWLRFVDTVSDPQNSRAKLPMRVVRALGQIIDSPGGALWRLDGGAGYALDLSWNLSIEHGKYFAGDDPFVTRLQAGEQIQIEDNADHPFGLKQAWLAVPLLYKNRLFGFVVLLLPHTGYLLDEEVLELLRTAGKQAGSYLAEEQASQALFDAQMITEFGKRFAFVVHDMKNLGGQLSLTLANAQNYLENPDYREDMLLTLQDAVKKLDRLVGQLRYSQSPENAAIEADSLIADVVKEFARLGAPVSSKLQAPCCSVRIEKDQFRSILHHLLNNAREAGEAVRPGSALPIIVSSRVTENKVLIDVVDKGAGMEEDFIREHLFRPFKSTKVGGLGIGAYQTRELLRMAGGDLAVISKKGVGTIMRITLPVANPFELIPAA